MIDDKNATIEKEDTKDWRHPSKIARSKEYWETPASFKKNFPVCRLHSQRLEKKVVEYGSNWNGGMPMLHEANDDSVYYDISDAHSLIFGSTGSKKTRLLVMPAVYLLGLAGESMIVSDPKAEIYERTAAALEERGYRITVINLREPLTGNQWNPLTIPYNFFINGEKDKACEFVNDIANNLMLAEIAVKDPYWDHSASDLLFGLIMLLFQYCKEYGYGVENVNMQSVQRLRVELFNSDIYSNELWKFAQQSEIITAGLIGTVNAPDRTQASILSVYDEKMRVFQMSSSLMEMLSGNDVDISLFDNEKQIFYLIMPDEKTSYHRIVSLFIKQSYEFLIYMAQSSSKKGLRNRVNYILDEFSSLPPINDFATMVSAARSRNIRFHLVVQSKHQLVQKYGDDAPTIMSNCMNWFFLTSRELELLREIAELCGVDKDKKTIISIQEMQRLDKNRGECLILSGRLKPFISTLLDINGYDQGKYKIRSIPKTVHNRTAILHDEGFIRVKEESSLNEHKSEDELRNILEYKCDELFGNGGNDENDE